MVTALLTLWRWLIEAPGPVALAGEQRWTCELCHAPAEAPACPDCWDARYW